MRVSEALPNLRAGSVGAGTAPGVIMWRFHFWLIETGQENEGVQKQSGIIIFGPV